VGGGRAFVVNEKDTDNEVQVENSLEMVPSERRKTSKVGILSSTILISQRTGTKYQYQCLIFQQGEDGTSQKGCS
jgi:hypothetical protein